MKYEEVNAMGAALQDYMGDEASMVVAVGCHRGSPGCESGSTSVTVTKSGFTATSEALRLADAALLARGKVNRMIEADRVKREKEKAEKEARG
jgi:hypothetical protein